ncbi:MAG: hypothetical protein IKO11_00110 [Lachnospiraceae bacterium]|nr:hypothetical protein [Lachnospiraceae bacterium]
MKYSANKNLGKGIVTIKGKGNYTGTNAKATFEIKDRAAIAKEAGEELVAGVKKIAKINETFVYNGLAQYPATLSVTLTDGTSVTLTHDGDGEYSGDKNVAVAVCNNVDKGTATVAAAGADGKYKTANFKIKVAEFGTAKIADGLEATYSVKGATPNDLVVTWTNGDDEEVELVAGQDYKATFKDNKKAGSGSIKLTGKGNFKGTLNGTFTINKFAPAEIDAVAAYTGVKAGAVKVTVLDGMGFALNQKKQLNVKVLDEDGKEIAAKTKLNAGQKISVVVTAKDTANVDIDESGLFAEVTVGDNLAKAKIDAKKLTKIYSGSAITLDDLDMGSVSVTYGKNKIELKNGEDFTIVGYTNNVKKGTMTVTIQGTGEETERGTFSGVKTFKVKVVPKTVE